MKNLKLSFALIIAVLAVGFTLASKANILGKRVITACFETVVITSATGSDFTLDGTLTMPPTCASANSAAATRPYLRSASNPLSSEEECPPSDQIFCCVTVTELNPAQHPNAPLVDLGEGDKPYSVTIHCKP